MESLKFLLTLSLFAITNAEVLENMHSTQADWNPESITDVVIRMRHVSQAANLQMIISLRTASGYERSCTIPISYMQNMMAAFNGYELPRLCSSMRLDESNIPTVEVQDLSGNYFVVDAVFIRTEHNAQFRASFPSTYYRSTSGPKRAAVFFPSNTVQLNTEIQCSGLNGQVAPESRFDSCPSNRMRVKAVDGKHNFFCGPGCDRVKNLNVHEVGNGYRCYRTTTPQDNPQYCCMDGQRGDIPGCQTPRNENNQQMQPDRQREPYSQRQSTYSTNSNHRGPSNRQGYSYDLSHQGQTNHQREPYSHGQPDVQADTYPYQT